MVGESGLSISSAIRSTGVLGGGSQTQRYGINGGFNVDAVAYNGRFDGLSSGDISDLAGSIKGSVGNLLTNVLRGLYPSQSRGPNGVNTNIPGPGAGNVSQGPALADGSGGGPQSTTSTNPNNGGLSPSQVQALNSQNKLDPVTLSQLLAAKTNKTMERRDPGLVNQGQPTADPKLNEALKKLGASLSEKLSSFDQKLKTALKNVDDGQFTDEFGASGFNSKDELYKFINEMKEKVKDGNFDQKTYDQFDRFTNSIPAAYSEIKSDAEEIRDEYKKGLDIQSKDLVAGNFVTATDDILGTEENKDSLLSKFDAKTSELEDDAKTRAEEFSGQAKSLTEKAREMFNDPNVGADEMQSFLDGEYNDGITKLKEQNTQLREDLGVEEGDKYEGDEVLDNMMFSRFSSPHSSHSEGLQSALEEITKDWTPEDKVTPEKIMENPGMQELYKSYYDDAFKSLPEGENQFDLEKFQKSIQEEPSTPSPSSPQVTNPEQAVTQLTEDSISFGDGLDDLVAEADIDLNLDIEEPELDLDLTLDA